jgi:hypothetical protein
VELLEGLGPELVRDLALGLHEAVEQLDVPRIRLYSGIRCLLTGISG